MVGKRRENTTNIDEVHFGGEKAKVRGKTSSGGVLIGRYEFQRTSRFRSRLAQRIQILSV